MSAEETKSERKPGSRTEKMRWAAKEHAAELSRDTALRVYETLFTHTAFGIAVVDSSRQLIRLANPAFAQMHGCDEAAVVGRSMPALVAPESAGAWNEAHEIIRSSDHHTFEAIHLRGDGSRFPCLVELAAVRDPQGAPLYSFGTFKDITVRKRAELGLREAHDLLERRVLERTAEMDVAKAKLDAVVKSSPDRIAAIDLDYRFITFNEEYREIVRTLYGVDVTLGASIDEIMPPERAAATRKIWSRALRGESFTLELEREVEGRTVYFETRFHPIRDTHGRIIGASQNSRDVTAIHRVADEIRRSNDQLQRAKELLETEAADRRKLEAKIAETIEAERQSLRNELHDGLCQELAGIGFMTNVLARNLAASKHPESGTARSISELVNGTLTRTRMLARGASPVEAGREGLMFALKDLSSATARAYGIACLFEGGSTVSVTNNAAASHLYRIAQEATHNAVEHGRAKLIRIRLAPHGDGARLSIVSDGIGYVEPGDSQSGMGLRLMRHRAAAIGVTLTIGPANESGGTAVVCEWKGSL